MEQEHQNIESKEIKEDFIYVNAGDTLSKIAQDNNRTVEQLIQDTALTGANDPVDHL